MRIFKVSRRVFPHCYLNSSSLLTLLACYALAFAPCRHVVQARILINEIYYDHPGADQGYEFIELLNTLDTAVCLEGYAIEFHNGSGTGWSSVWAGSMNDTVPPDGIFVVGGEYVGAGVDVITNLGLQNGPDALRISRNESEEDLIGYGELVDPRYFESSPAPDVPPGYSLGRNPDGNDTDNNSSDFMKMDPSPGLLNVPTRDLAIKIEGETGAIAFDGSQVEFKVIVQNRGLKGIGSLGYVVEIYDSTDVAVYHLTSFEGTDAIVPQDSIELEFSFNLGHGYHFITCVLKLPGDERPGNNGVDLVLRIGELELLISEVMSFPVDGCPQYIEIYNAGFRAIDITGWMIRDHAHSFSTIITRSFLMEPRMYAVLTKDSAALGVYFPNLEREKAIQVEGSWPYLNHSGSSIVADSIIMADSFRLAVEGIAYPPQEGVTKGKSLERVDLYPGERRHIWNLSTSSWGGSPGGENGIISFGPRTGNGVKVHPNPFYPREGGVLLIEIPFMDDATKVTVKIFDLNGHEVCDVGAASMLPAVFLWNGNGVEGMIVPGGIYIVASQIFLSSGKRVVERVVVGCGERK